MKLEMCKWSIVNGNTVSSRMTQRDSGEK